MAWRIEDHVVRGEIDNRVKGVVQGRIWLAGMEMPLQLTLTGNACPDLAGCLLRFNNQGDVRSLPKGRPLFPVQEGSIGDLTASRKVRVFDVPIGEALEMIDNGNKPPEHMSNSLYLEWFSSRNGRVVIESADFELEISEPEWQLTHEEDVQRSQTAMDGFSGFMEKMNQALNDKKEKVDHEKDDWDEFDYEHFLRESDARTDKYMELLDKYGDSEEGQEITAREMGWIDKDSGEADEDEAETKFDVVDADWANAKGGDEIPDFQPNPTTEGKDWIRTKDDDIRHPLQHKCFQGAMALWREIKALGSGQENGFVAELQLEYQTTGAKLAGALNDLAYGRDLFVPAFSAASLKRALSHLHAAQKALEKVQNQKVLPSKTTDRVRAEFFEIREGILHLLDEFRGRS
jgi:hypothetical protein